MRHLRRTGCAVLVLCTATVAFSAAQERDDWTPRRTRRYGAQIRIGRSFHLAANEVVNSTIVVIGGSATLDGRANDDVVVIGGDVRIGPRAQIRGDVTSVGGAVVVDDAAQVMGEIHEVRVNWPNVRILPWIWLRWTGDRAWWALVGLGSSVFRLTLIGLGVALLALIAPAWIGRIAQRVTFAPGASAGIGLIVELLFLPILVVTILGLVISIVGIPLLLLVPFVLLAGGVIWLAGFTAVVVQLGYRLRLRLGAVTPAPLVDAFCGLVLVSALTMIGHLLAFGAGLAQPLAAAFGAAGLAVEYIAWTIGLGAALATPLDNRRPGLPPFPTTASTSAAA